jgi:hypothetical protein
VRAAEILVSTNRSDRANPTSPLPSFGAIVTSFALWTVSGPWPKAPPRKTRLTASVRAPECAAGAGAAELSWHHSHTLPRMSKRPKSLGRNVPTGCSRLQELLTFQAYLDRRSSPSQPSG